MTDDFERALADCIELVRAGRRSIDDCVRLYPHFGERLRLELLTVVGVQKAFEGVTPPAEFTERARERFLVATGQRLHEAMYVEPSPTFFASARVRFLMAAQKMGLAQRSRGRATPFIAAHFRALAGSMAAVAVFLGAGTYTVASADNSLPGDWQYPVKLQTERVRLALTFSDDARHDVKLDIAEERAEEIEKLAERGRAITPGVIDRLVDQTAPLVEAAENGELDAEEAARLREIAQKQKQVLAQISGAVEPEAQEKLTEAVELSRQAVEVSARITANDPQRPPQVVTASVELTPTPSPSPTATQTAPATPDATAPAGTPADPATPLPATPVEGVVVGEEPVATRDSIKLIPLSSGRVRITIPAPEHGWSIVREPGSSTPELVRITNDPAILGSHGSSLLVISTLTGDMYWYVNFNGRLDEVQMRVTRNGKVFVADEDVVRATYGDLAKVPLIVLDSIEVIQDPTPTPSPTVTPTADP
ncbi:MAG TPA: DUF5667 domain-containing protein [Dehalococcoidia bacterium]|nr:DUF5667 domain-containing protein [Dehalococcoidia bacterium]